jgi:chloramphenicol O-acetyltransferase type A
MTPAYTPDIIAPIDAPFERGPQLRWFDAMDDPRLNVTAELMAPDFVTAAKARTLPPFAVLFHAISGASLDVDAFRWRLTDQGEPFRVNALLPSYTVQNTQGHVNFSYVPFTEDLDAFVKAYHADKHEAETATGMRTNVKAAPECGQLYCTGLPFLRFTSIEHPALRRRRPGRHAQYRSGPVAARGGGPAQPAALRPDPSRPGGWRACGGVFRRGAGQADTVFERLARRGQESRQQPLRRQGAQPDAQRIVDGMSENGRPDRT